MSGPFDPYYRWLAIKPQDQPPHHYRLLGVDLFESDPTVIENAADQRMTHLRSFSSGPHGTLAQRLLNEVSAARICLLSPEKRKQYDAQLRAAGVGAAATSKPAPLPMAQPLAPQPSPVVTTPPQSSVAAGRARASRGTIPPVALIAGGGGALLLLLVIGVAIAVIASGGGDAEENDDAEPSSPMVHSDGEPPPAPAPATMTQTVHPVLIAVDSGEALPPGEEIDLLAAAFTAALSAPPPWLRREGTLVADLAAEPLPRLRASVEVPAEYRLDLAAVAPQDYAGIVFDLPTEGRRFQLVVDREDKGGYYSGLEDAETGRATAAGTRRRQPLCTAGDVKSLSATVRPGEIVLECDGEEVMHWQGDPARLVASADNPSPRRFERQPPLDVVPITIQRLRVVSLMPETPPEKPTPPPVVVQDPTPPSEPPEEPTVGKPTTAESPKALRRNVPDEAEQARARAEVNRTFASRREEAQSREAKLELARELLATANSVEDEAVKYVLLRDARELAVEADDAAVALQAVNRLDEAFEVYVWRLRGDALERIAKTSKSPLRRDMALGAAQQVLYGAIDEEKFEEADQLAETVQVASRRAKQFPLAKLATDLRREIAALREQQAAVDAARTALETNPDDPAANGVLGDWLMQQEQWNEALAHLAKSDDDALRLAAEKEIAAGDEPSLEVQLELADAWWTLAQSQDADSTAGSRQAALLARARFWYRRVLPSLESVLTKRRVEDRLATPGGAESESGSTGRPIVVTPWMLRDALLLYTFEPSGYGKVDGKFLLADLSGSNHHGTIVGSPQPQVLKGQAGAALAFQGRDDAVVVNGLRNEMAAGLRQITVAAWIEPEKFDRSAFVFNVGHHAETDVSLHIQDGQYTFDIPSAHGGNLLRAPITEKTGWHHVAGVWDGKEQRLYVDGRLVAKAPTTLRAIDDTTLAAIAAHLGIQAKREFRTGRWYIGAIDELFVLPGALTQQEVAACVEAGKAGIVLPSLVER